MTTIIWDWNGTLLDDTAISLAALNEILIARDVKPITIKFYRDNFRFPVREFYSQCGLDLSRVDWDLLARDYHDAYLSRQAKLFYDVRDALSRARDLGFRQAVLSNLRQDYLDVAIDRFAIREFFVAIRGSDNMNGASKIANAERFIRELATNANRDFVFVGDSLHDAEVAMALNSRCVLFSGGTHTHSRLEVAAPTFQTLREIVDFLYSR